MRKMKSKKIKFCPKCGSDKVVKKIYGSLALGAPQPWKCEECGFESDIFPEIDKNKLKLIQKQIKNDTRRKY